ncbi:MAG: UDP-N-acetylmuramoyl-L-alanine--D-glutamate ligase [Chthoniobacterales bacterium]
MIYSGQHALVLGLGHSGKAAAILLAEEGARVTVSDSADTPALRETAEALESHGINAIFGPEAESDPTVYDLCVLSPGIDPAQPIVQNVLKKKIPIIGELELGFEECHCPVVAITGTNGKTTTTLLTEHILNTAGVRTAASGNIGTPFAQAIRESRALDVMTLEVSSFQLETIVHFHPHIAVWLNFSPDHLDRYPDIESYRAAKLRVFERQTETDFQIVNAREAADLPTSPATRFTFSATVPDADFRLVGTTIQFRDTPILDFNDTHLRGLHNAENLMAALAIGHALRVDLDRLAKSVLDFASPVHRCEFVRDLDGVQWVNDSKATTLESVSAALTSYDSPIVLIAGGKDKGFEFDPIADQVKANVRAAVLIGEMRDRIATAWPETETHAVDSMEAAVAKARSLAHPGDAVILSPGTSSFDMYKNYGARGDAYKAAVNSLSPA